MSWPHTFANLSGDVPASYLDDNFAAAALATDLTTLSTAVATLPSSATPLAPTAGGSAGASSAVSRDDHKHPPQPATPSTKTGNYTVTSADDGLVLEYDSTSAGQFTLPANAAVGFSILVCQVNTAQVQVVAASGATLRQRSSYSKTAGQWAVLTAYCRKNVGGSAAEYVLSGDMSS